MVLTKEVTHKISDLITAGFGLVAALAWNNAIQDAFEAIFGKQQGSLYAKFFYALLVTLVAVAATVWIARLAKTKEDESKKK